jgi:hypothetical protein
VVGFAGLKGFFEWVINERMASIAISIPLVRVTSVTHDIPYPEESLLEWRGS